MAVVFAVVVVAVEVVIGGVTDDLASEVQQGLMTQQYICIVIVIATSAIAAAAVMPVTVAVTVAVVTVVVTVVVVAVAAVADCSATQI